MNLVTVWLLIAMEVTPSPSGPNNYRGILGGTVSKSAALCSAAATIGNESRTEAERKNKFFTCIPIERSKE